MDCGSGRHDIAFVEPAVTLYAIYDPQPGKPALPAAVPEKFSFLAALLPPVFLLRHGLWLELAGFILAVLALRLAAGLIGGDAAFALYLLAALWLGFAAADLRRLALRRRGWHARGPHIAASAELAQLEALS
tara:strand:+ start:1351 stop:1746 length:396 start_codon:yes stop_codon:yes gene_type:complete